VENPQTRNSLANLAKKRFSGTSVAVSKRKRKERIKKQTERKERDGART